MEPAGCAQELDRGTPHGMATMRLRRKHGHSVARTLDRLVAGLAVLMVSIVFLLVGLSGASVICIFLTLGVGSISA